MIANFIVFNSKKKSCMKNLVYKLFFISSLLLGQSVNYDSLQLNGEDYITGEDGVPRMSINIWGHVKQPGTFLVYDGIDLYTCLSLAGGPLKGAKISEIIVLSIDGKIRKVNLDSDTAVRTLIIKPHDTIKVDEKFSNVLLTKTSIISVILQLTNVILTATKN